MSRTNRCLEFRGWTEYPPRPCRKVPLFLLPTSLAQEYKPLVSVPEKHILQGSKNSLLAPRRVIAMAVKYSDWKWHNYYWYLCEQFGRECYKTWRWELAFSAVGYLFTALITHNWRDFKTNLASAGLTLAAFVLWHSVRSPWLLRKAEIAKQPDPGKLAGAFGIVIVISMLFGAYLLADGFLKSDARHLSPNDLETFSGMIRANAGTVNIAATMNDSEAYELADQLTLGFFQGYWRINPMNPSILMGGGPPIGEITIEYRDPSDKRHELIQDAMKRVGLNADSRYSPDSNPAFDITVYVGKHTHD
jgi:hypothetical protein